MASLRKNKHYSDFDGFDKCGPYHSLSTRKKYDASNNAIYMILHRSKFDTSNFSPIFNFRFKRIK